uniref:Uncharacterized protein n=1 Tax=Rhizophora mucronata TaxID=61149 RepID=A0A2P2N9C4_RHIMU
MHTSVGLNHNKPTKMRLVMMKTAL